MDGSFKLVSNFQPTGDQPEAINRIVDSINAGNRFQTLLGVTGSGKTFTMANVIQRVQRPTLVLALSNAEGRQLGARRFLPHDYLNGAPKQVEKVGVGSVTPRSVPATFDVKPDKK